MEYINVHQSVFDDFAQRYPYLADKVVEWYAGDRYEITAKLEDGDIVTYNQLNKSYRYDKHVDGEVSDDKWGEAFSDRLRKKMFNRGVSQKRLSEDTGISETTISYYLCGSRIPSAQNITKIAKALHCSSSELIDF